MSQLHRIYTDDRKIAITVNDGLIGDRLINSLVAIAGTVAGTVSVKNKRLTVGEGTESETSYFEITNAPFADIVDGTDTPYGVDVSSTINALNTLFSDEGTATADKPSFPVALSFTTVEDGTINYTINVNDAIAIEYPDGLPTGLTTQDGSSRKLIGSMGLSYLGVTTVNVRAYNHNGYTDAVLTITLTAAPYVNSKAVEFYAPDYLQNTNTTQLQTLPCFRPNLSDTSDPFTLLFDLELSNISAWQCLFSTGDNTNNSSRFEVFAYEQVIQIRIEQRINGSVFSYTGAAFNNIPAGAGRFTLMCIYNGSSTNTSVGTNCFSLYVNGVEVQGTSFGGGSPLTQVPYSRLYVGTQDTSAFFFDSGSNINNFAIFDEDRGTDAALLYNDGVSFDYNTLQTPPVSWWQMGDGDTFPTLQDSSGSVPLTMTNQTAANIVNI